MPRSGMAATIAGEATTRRRRKRKLGKRRKRFPKARVRSHEGRTKSGMQAQRRSHGSPPQVETSMPVLYRVQPVGRRQFAQHTRPGGREGKASGRETHWSEKAATAASTLLRGSGEPRNKEQGKCLARCHGEEKSGKECTSFWSLRHAGLQWSISKYVCIIDPSFWGLRHAGPRRSI